MKPRHDPKVRMIPLAQINVLNPRDRSKKKFTQITGNIAKLGLKRPVRRTGTVCSSSSASKPTSRRRPSTRRRSTTGATGCL